MTAPALTTGFITPSPMSAVAELNRCAPDRIDNAFQKLNGPQVALGDLLQMLIYHGNQLAAQGAASVAASATVTIATPAAGDIVNVTIQGSLWAGLPLLPAVLTSYKLTTADAASATTAATAVSAALNTNPAFSQLAVATHALGVVTITAKWKGTNANAMTLTSGVTGAGGTTAVASGATLTGGTGVDDVPLLV